MSFRQLAQDAEAIDRNLSLRDRIWGKRIVVPEDPADLAAAMDMRPVSPTRKGEFSYTFLLHGERIGSAIGNVTPLSIIVRMFFPMRDLQPFWSGLPRKRYRRLGIGTLAQWQMVEAWSRAFPETLEVTVPSISNAYRRLHGAAGVGYSGIPLTEYVDAWRLHAERRGFQTEP